MEHKFAPLAFASVKFTCTRNIIGRQMSTMPQPSNGWKEAATVILTARAGNLASQVSSIRSVTDVNAAYGPPSLNRYTLSLDSSPSTGYDYEVLLLKRSSKSKFMPNACVFPGGALSPADFSPEWLDIFRSLKLDGVSISDRMKLPSAGPGRVRPQLYDKVYEYKSPLIPEISFRICGIRETFEESGVLLYTDENEVKHSGRKRSIPSKVLTDFQAAVNKDANEFIKLFREMKIVPDVWSLCDWSNWLTPINMPHEAGGKRFDTQFYMACLPVNVQETHDQREIVSAKWFNPEAALAEFRAGSITLAPPQLYELGRVMNVFSLSELETFAKHRAELGCPRWLPVRCAYDDGYISLLPGDDRYPDTPDIEGVEEPISVSGSVKGANSDVHNLNCMRMGRLYDCEVVCNITDPHGHNNPQIGVDLSAAVMT